MAQARVSQPVLSVPSPGRVKIGALQLDRLDFSELERRLCALVESGAAHQAVTANLHFITVARQNPSFAEIVNQADLVVADGMPLLWVSRMQRAPIPARITGHDILHACASLSVAKGYSLFLLGGGPGVAATAASRLRVMYPGIHIVGTFHGDFTADGLGACEATERDAVAAIRSARPDFLFVGLGCPKQEFWIHRHLNQIAVPVSTGIGSVLDVLSGSFKRAPDWMQRTGLEWAYRIKQEPSRLWKRYFIEDVPMALRLTSAAVIARNRQ